MCLKSYLKTYLDYYGLDPCHYLSSPGLSWHAMLKMSATKLDLTSDIDMHLLIEKGMRDGISYIFKRYSEANSKCMKYYGISEESKFIMCLDANSLYGWAMSQ